MNGVSQVPRRGTGAATSTPQSRPSRVHLGLLDPYTIEQPRTRPLVSRNDRPQRPGWATSMRACSTVLCVPGWSFEVIESLSKERLLGVRYAAGLARMRCRGAAEHCRPQGRTANAARFHSVTARVRSPGSGGLVAVSLSNTVRSLASCTRPRPHSALGRPQCGSDSTSQKQRRNDEERVHESDNRRRTNFVASLCASSLIRGNDAGHNSGRALPARDEDDESE